MKYNKYILLWLLFVSSLTAASSEPQPVLLVSSFLNPECSKTSRSCIQCANDFKQNNAQQNLQWLLANAIYNQMDECVSRLIALGIDPNYLSEGGPFSTPLNLAVRYNSQNIIPLLISAGASPDQADAFGVLPVFEAITSGHCATIPLIFAKSGTPNSMHSYNQHRMKSLTLALITNKFECIKELTRLGIDINQQVSGEWEDINGYSPLMLSLTGGHTELAKRLVIELAADSEVRNANGDTALLMMVKMNHIKAAKVLVEELGANLWAVDNQIQNPAEAAKAKGFHELTQYLTEAQNKQSLFYQIVTQLSSLRTNSPDEIITYSVSTLALALIPVTIIFICCRSCCA